MPSFHVSSTQLAEVEGVEVVLRVRYISKPEGGPPCSAGAQLHRFMMSFTYSRDAGALLVSHFSLLTGCAVPVWLAASGKHRMAGSQAMQRVMPIREYMNYFKPSKSLISHDRGPQSRRHLCPGFLLIFCAI